MALTASDLRGVIAALVTPFSADEALDLDALRVVVRHIVDGGAHGIMTTGGTGEFPSLSREEKRAVIAAAVAEAGGKVPVVAGTAACSTREAVELSRDAREAGADAVIVTAPYYFPLPEAALHEHYRRLAHEAGLPVVVYNNPLYTGNSLSPALIAALLELPGVVGLKQSSSDLGQLVEVISRCGDGGASIATGIDSQFYPALCAGAAGIYSTAATVVPAQMAEVYERFRRGDHAGAVAMHYRLQPFNRFLEYDPGYVAPAKEALKLMGLPGGSVRAPLPALTDEERVAIAAALTELGVMRADAASRR